MPARQLESRCWVPGWPGDQRDERRARDNAHYPAALAIPSFGSELRLATFHARCAGVVAMHGTEPGLCDACGAENLGQSDLQTRILLPRQLATPCWVAECCRCGDLLSDTRTGPVHFEGWSSLIAWIAKAGWRVSSDRHAACADCAPADRAAAPGDDEEPADWAGCRVGAELDTAYAGTVRAFTGLEHADGAEPAPPTVPAYLDFRQMPGGGLLLTVGGTNVRAVMDPAAAGQLADVAGLAAGNHGGRR